MWRLTITLLDGTTGSYVVPSMPRHWKSWLMHQMPYGTSMQGCTFTRSAYPYP